MATFNIVCGGPGPHTPASGILGTSDRPPTADVRCANPACVRPLDVETVNHQTLLDQATAAFTANRTDITQAESVSTQAAALAATTGTFTLAQATTHIRSLATAVKVLADHDVSSKKQMNAAMRLILQSFDGTD